MGSCRKKINLRFFLKFQFALVELALLRLGGFVLGEEFFGGCEAGAEVGDIVGLGGATPAKSEGVERAVGVATDEVEKEPA